MSKNTATINTRYDDLIKKIEQARRLDCLIINSNGQPNPYEVERQIIIDKYFKGSWGKETKEELLNQFERINETIKFILGL